MWKEIQKFGPKYSDLPTMISNINVLMRALTLNVDNRDTKPISITSYVTTVFCTVVYYYGYQFSAMWFVAWRPHQPEDLGTVMVFGSLAVSSHVAVVKLLYMLVYGFVPLFLFEMLCTVVYYYGYQFSAMWFVAWRPHQPDDLGAVMVFGSLAISSHVAVVKLLYMLVYGSKVRCLVEQCIQSNALSVSDTRFSRNVANILRTVKIRGIAIWICINSISVAYLTIPAFLPGRHLPADALVFYGLEPAFQTPFYHISYSVTYVSVTYICYIVSTISAFLIIIIGFTEAQMISLSKEILYIWDDAVHDAIDFQIDFLCVDKTVPTFDEDTENKINFGVRKRLVQIMQRHSRIITLLKNVNGFFDIPNAFSFVCLGISLIAELLGGLDNTYLQIPFTFLQVAADCFIGQKIMDASVAFEKAVYACKWENFNKENMKIILLMLQNSQKTLTMSAGSMTVLNFSCLMNIVRSVYSAYTTLRSAIK